MNTLSKMGFSWLTSNASKLDAISIRTIDSVSIFHFGATYVIQTRLYIRMFSLFKAGRSLFFFLKKAMGSFTNSVGVANNQ